MNIEAAFKKYWSAKMQDRCTEGLAELNAELNTMVEEGGWIIGDIRKLAKEEAESRIAAKVSVDLNPHDDSEYVDDVMTTDDPHEMFFMVENDFNDRWDDWGGRLYAEGFDVEEPNWKGLVPYYAPQMIEDAVNLAVASYATRAEGETFQDLFLGHLDQLQMNMQKLWLVKDAVISPVKAA